MFSFLQLARSVGYKVARAQFTFQVEKPEKLHQYIDSFDRADFHFMLPLSADSTVLDLGSGYGNITIPLAKHYKKVIAVDTSLELLQFVKLRAESEGLTNIEYVHADPFEYCNLPFNKNLFDAIIVSGVLEWIGAAKLDEKPKDLQEKFLKQIRGFVKEDGILYIAIENRLFPGYLHRDPHSKLRYTTHLPRFLADWYAKRKGQLNGYRTYIYSMFGYKRLLRSAGFTKTVFLLPFTGYRNPSVIWPDRSEAVSCVLRGGLDGAHYTKKWLLVIRVCNFFRLPGLFLSSYMIIASPISVNKVPSILHMATRVVSHFNQGDFVIKVCDGKEGIQYARFLVFHGGETKPFGFLTVPRDPDNGKMQLSFTSMDEYDAG